MTYLKRTTLDTTIIGSMIGDYFTVQKPHFKRMALHKQQKTKENNIHESWVTFLKTVQAPSFQMLHLLEVTYCAKCFELQMFGRSQLKRTHYITDANQMIGKHCIITSLIILSWSFWVNTKNSQDNLSTHPHFSVLHIEGMQLMFNLKLQSAEKICEFVWVWT